MNMWPVIERELRTEARRPAMYWMRFYGALVAMVVCVLVLASTAQSPAVLGPRLFSGLNAAFFVAIWLLAPLLTADCISRERREGTLGLLLLTPLKPLGIVSGKSLVHALRSASLLLAMTPMLVLSLLFGGVGWKDGVMAVLLDGSALLLALTAGLLASGWVRDWSRAVLGAELLGLAFGLVFICVNHAGFGIMDSAVYMAPRMRQSPTGAALWAAFRQQGGLWHIVSNITSLPFNQYQLMDVLSLNTSFNSGFRGPWQMQGWSRIWSGWPLTMQQYWFSWLGVLGALSGLAAMLTVIATAFRVGRIWQYTAPSPQKLWLWRTFCTPRFWRSVFRSKMRRALDRNPVGWLHQYSWNARLIKWGWCLAIVMLELWLASSNDAIQSLVSFQYVVAIVMLVTLAFCAASSFRSERETGAMELLLVSPLRERQIIVGRIRGLWGQFFPATGLLLLVWLFLMVFWGDFKGYTFGFAGLNSGTPEWDAIRLPALVAGSLVVLPVVGLFFSLGKSNLILSWGLTCVVGLILPSILAGTVYPRTQGSPGLWLACFLGCQLLATVIAGGWLYRNLRQRIFALSR